MDRTLMPSHYEFMRKLLREKNIICTYKKKPVEIEAIQFDGSNMIEINAFMSGKLRFHPIHESPMINTLEGDHIISTNDYVIKGIRGEFYPCKPDIFHATYEACK